MGPLEPLEPRGPSERPLPPAVIPASPDSPHLREAVAAALPTHAQPGGDCSVALNAAMALNALVEKGGAWTYGDLDAFLSAPKAYVPGTKMLFPGFKKPQDRANLILYLHSLSDEPPPLP